MLATTPRRAGSIGPFRLAAAASAVLLLLSACGGGGDGGTAAPEGGTEIQYVAAGYDSDPLFRTGYYVGSESAGQLRLGTAPAIGVTRQSDGSYTADATAQATYKTKSRLGGAMTEICEIAGFTGQYYGTDQDRTAYVVVTTALQPLGANELNELYGKAFEGTHGCDPGTRVRPGPPYAGQVERGNIIFDNSGGFVVNENGGSPGGTNDPDVTRQVLTTKFPQVSGTTLFQARLRPFRVPGSPARYVLVEAVYPEGSILPEPPFIRIWEEVPNP